VLRPETPEPGGTDPGRALLLDLYHTAIRAVDGRAAMARAAAERAIVDTAVIAVGKAALPMLAGVKDVLGAHCVRAFVVTTAAAEVPPPDPYTHVCIGDHPVPGPRSLAAGDALNTFLDALPPGLPVWVLVSGGASSLLERLLPGVTLGDVRALNEWALARDVPIATLNALRRRLSAYKDGRLAARLADRPALAFVVSDVPGDDPAVVGSGVVAAWPGDPLSLPAALPDALRRCFERVVPPRGATLPTVLVGSLAQALDAIDAHARALGYTVERWPTRVEGPAVEAGQAIARRLERLTVDLLVAGGETTVQLPPAPGVGGRCQQLALAAALAVAGQDGVVLLAAGTDGIDGASADAGAVIDGGTVARAAADGIDAQASLDAADAGSCLAASGDLVHTGPTATNVGDIILGWRVRAGARERSAA
jgi:hydroxypyruvate reductase